MKKLIKAVLLLLLISSFAFAQSKFSYGLGLTTETAMFLNSGQPADEDRKCGGGFAIEGIMQYNFTERLFVRSGLGYGIYRQSINNRELIFPDQIDPRTGVVESGEKGKMNWWASGAMVNIPLELGFRFPFSKSEEVFFAGIGSAFHINVAASETIKIFNPDGSKNKFNTGGGHVEEGTGFSFKVFTGLEKPLGKTSFIAIEPYLRLTNDRYRPEIGLSMKNSMLYDYGLTLRIRKK